MEVHHHAHSSRKKWTHYFWEFLMLFLAVFCGFFAEYQLEHKIESDRGRQYAASMYEDLRMDTLQLNSVFERRLRREEILDSLFHELDQKGKEGDLYYFARHLTRTAPIAFLYNDRTIQQLKHSGGLRLITNKRVSDGIVEYDRQLRLIQERQENEIITVRESLPYCFAIFDGRIFEAIQDSNNIISRLQANPPLLKFSAQDLNTFLGYLQLIKATNRANTLFLKDLKKEAIKLIQVIRDEYQLK